MPGYCGRALSRRGDRLLYASNRLGSMQAYLMDIKNGQSRLLTSAAQLDAATLQLSPDDNNFYYFDEDTLWQSSLSAVRGRAVYQVPGNWRRGEGLSLLETGLYALLSEESGGTKRLRQINLVRATAVTIWEGAGRIAHPQPRPRRASVLYRGAGESLWLVHSDGQQNRRLQTAPGASGPARWSPDGRTVLYLNFPDDPKKLKNLREHNPDTGEDRLIAVTTQFVHFGANADASVFVGPSGSKASPHVLLLLRVARREFTLCEHRSSDPAIVAPIFSPDSQRIYFQSDRHGKPAIYSMVVDRLVEKTEAETSETRSRD